jgi:hypothetical protein
VIWFDLVGLFVAAGDWIILGQTLFVNRHKRHIIRFVSMFF